MAAQSSNGEEDNSPLSYPGKHRGEGFAMNRKTTRTVGVLGILVLVLALSTSVCTASGVDAQYPTITSSGSGGAIVTLYGTRSGNDEIYAKMVRTTHTITASAGANGTISPNGPVTVNDGANQVFWITPNTGYHIDTLTVDGAPVTLVQAVIFNNVTADHSINASFAADRSTFYFAEGTCRPNFDPYFCIQNPGSSAAEVKLTYMKGNGSTDTDQVTVAPNSRSTVVPRTKLGTGNDAAHDFSTKVECTNGQSIIAERPMYFNYNGVWTGGHDVVGATNSASTFYFAEGTCRPNFDPYFCIQNPGSSPAEVNLTYMKGDGSTATDHMTVAANSRSTVVPRNKLGTSDDAAHDFSTKVECTNGQSIIAERPMYFNYNGVWTGGHDVVGFVPSQ